MKKHIIIRILLLLAAWSGVKAQSVYTLEQCKQLAVENNYGMKNSRLDREMATQTRNEAFTNYFPSITAVGTIFWSTDNLLQLDVPIPLQIPGLPSELSMGMLNKGKSAGILALQPIFAGGQIVNGNRLARIGEDVSSYRLVLAEQEVKIKTEEYFWQIISLQEKLRTIESVEEQLAEIEKDVRTMVEAGVTTRNDLLRVELQQQDVAATRLQVENGLRVSKLLLRQYTGIPEDIYDVVADISSPDSPLSCYIPAKEAVANRVESELLNKSVEAASAQYQLAIGKNLPTVAVGGGYLYQDFTGKDVGNGVIMINASIPISSWWGGAYDIKKEKLNRQKVENERKNSLEMMEMEIEVKWNDLQESYKQILLAEKSVESSAENLRMNRDFYQAGTITLTDLLDAQTLFRQSKDKYSDAVVDYRLKMSFYLQATGR